MLSTCQPPLEGDASSGLWSGRLRLSPSSGRGWFTGCRVGVRGSLQLGFCLDSESASVASLLINCHLPFLFAALAEQTSEFPPQANH